MASGFDTALGALLNTTGQGYAGLQQIQADRARQQYAVAQAGLLQQKQQQAQAFQEGVSAYTSNPTPEGLVSLAMRFPEQAEGLQTAWKIKDATQKQADLTTFSSVYAAAKNGRKDLVLNNLRNRRDAEAKAGMDTKELDQVIEDVDTDQPDALKSVQSVALAHMYAGDAEAFRKVFNIGQDSEAYTLSPGSKRYDANNNLVAEAPFAPEYRSVGQGDTLVEVNGGGGGTAAGGSGDTRAVRNKNPGNLRVSGFTKSQPGYVGQDKDGFAVFESPEAGKNAQISLLRNYGSRGFDTVAKIVSRWAPPSDGNDTGSYIRTVAKAIGKGPTEKLDMNDQSVLGGLQAIMARVEGGGTPTRNIGGSPGTGARVVAVGAPKDGYRFLSPQEKAQQGLPANVAYQISPDGKVEAPTGQDTRTTQALAVPPSQQKAILENHSTLRQVNAAIDLVTNNKGAFGYGTGMLGQAFLNYNDPKGIPARAAVQAIGAKTLHDLSGAAVTASEAPRFEPFIPNLAKDSADTILKKLQRFKDQLTGDQDDLLQAYGPENGYRGMKLPGQPSAPVKVTSLQQAKALKPGTLYVTPQGKVMRR